MDKGLETKLRITRFMHYLKENPQTGCQEWTATRYKRGGYGQFFWGVVDGKEKIMKASRAAWILFRGEIPEGGNVLHKCNNPPCCNVDHLYIGTHLDNAKDRDRAGRTRRGPSQVRWKQTPELAQRIVDEIHSGKQLADVCATIGIGWQTLYRMRARYPVLNAACVATKSARYSVGARKR